MVLHFGPVYSQLSPEVGQALTICDQKSKQYMLRSNLVDIQSLRLAPGQFQTLLRVLGEEYLASCRPFDSTTDLGHHSSRFVQGQPHRGQDADIKTFTLIEQGQKELLATDVQSTEVGSFTVGKNNHPDRLFGETVIQKGTTGARLFCHYIRYRL